MKDQLITFKVAKLAKEKGFNIECLLAYHINQLGNQMKASVKGVFVEPEIEIEYEAIMGGETASIRSYTQYDKGYILAPTQSLLQRWLREIHYRTVKVDDFYTDSKIRYDYNIMVLGSQDDDPRGLFESYEDALEKGLEETLKLI